MGIQASLVVDCDELHSIHLRVATKQLPRNHT
jgi:hypothetical protein